MSDLYDRIKELADEHDITGKELGNLLGLKKSPLTDWKNGKSCPTVEQLIKLCDIFASSADWLLFGSKDKNSSLSEREKAVFSLYNSLNGSDQREICEFMKVKLKNYSRTVFDTYYIPELPNDEDEDLVVIKSPNSKSSF